MAGGKLGARNDVWLRVKVVIGRVVLGEIFGSELFKEIFTGILLQGLHMMKYGRAERHEITLVRI